MKLSESVEMYLETVYNIQKDHGHAHVVDIAQGMGVSKPSVSKAMKQLSEEGLVNRETYGHITLTQKGEKFSKEVVRKHENISRYLELSLNLGAGAASINACKMEHVISDEMMEAIEGYLNKNDPLWRKE